MPPHKLFLANTFNTHIKGLSASAMHTHTHTHTHTSLPLEDAFIKETFLSGTERSSSKPLMIPVNNTTLVM